MVEKLLFLFFCTIFVANVAFCQKTLHFRETSRSFGLSFPYHFSFNTFHQKASPVIPSGFAVTQLGFFCKKELHFEQVTKIPLRFRLGSINFCNRMEGKINSALLALD